MIANQNRRYDSSMRESAQKEWRRPKFTKTADRGDC